MLTTKIRDYVIFTILAFLGIYISLNHLSDLIYGTNYSYTELNVNNPIPMLVAALYIVLLSFTFIVRNKKYIEFIYKLTLGIKYLFIVLTIITTVGLLYFRFSDLEGTGFGANIVFIFLVGVFILFGAILGLLQLSLYRLRRILKIKK